MKKVSKCLQDLEILKEKRCWFFSDIYPLMAKLCCFGSSDYDVRNLKSCFFSLSWFYDNDL